MDSAAVLAATIVPVGVGHDGGVGDQTQHDVDLPGRARFGVRGAVRPRPGQSTC